MRAPFTFVGILMGAFALFASAIASPPVIKPSTSFQHKVVELGKRTSLSVIASGDTPLYYQWRLDGRELSAQTNRSLALNAVQAPDEGDYTVAVSNLDGAVLSEPVRLWVVPPPTELVKRNFTNEAGLRLPYFIAAPADYDPGRSYPLVCLFTGGHGDEAVFPSFTADNPVTRVFTSYQQQLLDTVILVWPCRRAGDPSWTDLYLGQASDLVDHLLSELNIDTNRVYIVGISGGTGLAWDLVSRRPGLVAAASIMSGSQGKTRATDFKDVPFWAGCAADDETGNLGPTRSAVLALRSAGASVIYTEYKSGGHIGGCTMLASTPEWVHWFLAQWQGQASTREPLLSIRLPTPEAAHTTGAPRATLAGTAQAAGQTVTQVTWQNIANKTAGDASGTNAWSTTDIPLLADRTNVIIVTATTTSWAPAFAGKTTFSDTLTVVSTPLRVTLRLQETEAMLSWAGGVPPFEVQAATDVFKGDWERILTNAVPPLRVPVAGSIRFFRVVGD